MNRVWIAALLAVALAAAGSAPAGAGSAPGAPERPPYIGYVYPAGGRQGTTVDVVIGGENVTGSTAAIASGKGVTVEITDAGETALVMDPLTKKKKLKKNQTVIDEIVKLRVTLAPDAEPGPRDLCLVTPNGLSNKRVFQVGQLPEVRETEPNDKPATALPLPPLPVTVNGQVMPGDTDCFRFSARKGQRLVVEASARALIPYIADAVPGWFQAIVSLHDAKGRVLAVADEFRFSQDPVLFFDVPDDSDYLFSIRDSIYRGRADFVYRVRIGELPFITGVFPLGAPRGDKPVTVRLSGVNLPGETLAVPVSQPAPSTQFLSVTRSGLVSNRVPFAVGTLPEVLAAETATAPATPQPLAAPVVVNGRIRTPGQSDYFSFAGKKDQAFSIEVRARRLGSPVDACIVLMNGRGEKIAENDDAKDKGEGILTHQADAAIFCRLPADGTYTIRIYDIQGKGGDEYAYRLRLSPPAPDFDLRATPSELGIPKGGSEPLTVHAIRRDGFTGEIRLAFDEPAPPGLALDGAVIPEGTDKVRITVTASPSAAAATLFPALHGTAVLNGKPVTRPVVPAEELMQAFAYQHLVPAKAQVVTITDPPAPFTVSFQLPDGFLALTRGKEVSFPITVTRRPGFEGPIRVTLADPPKGVTARQSGAFGGRDRGLVTLRTESDAEVKANGNLILIATMVLVKEAPAAEADKPGGATPGTPEAKPAVSRRAGNAGKKTSDPPAATGDAPPAATAAPGGKPADAAGKAAPAPGEPKKLYERWIVTLPAVPFHVIGPAPEKKPATGPAPKN
jgi:hypothetical protein